MELEDALILEDNKLQMNKIILSLDKKIKYTMVINSSELRKYLKKGKRAKLYFLDDVVPWIDGRNRYSFKEHSEMIFKLDPDAKIFYTGMSPRKGTDEYCLENKIEMIDRAQIYRIMNKELKNV